MTDSILDARLEVLERELDLAKTKDETNILKLLREDEHVKCVHELGAKLKTLMGALAHASVYQQKMMEENPLFELIDRDTYDQHRSFLERLGTGFEQITQFQRNLELLGSELDRIKTTAESMTELGESPTLICDERHDEERCVKVKIAYKNLVLAMAVDVEKRIPKLPKVVNAEGASREVRSKAWKDYWEAQKVNREFAAERLEIFAGLAFRKSRLDENACRLADELIGKCNLGISPDDWLTIPAPKEALGRTLARIVRLRFPEWKVWALPLVAHEYGHVLFGDDGNDTIGSLGEEEATARALDGVPEAARTRWLRELVVETFSTYIMGPAYACAAIWLRLNPYCGDEEQADRCLLDLYRASIILEALTWEKKGEMAVVGHPYKEIAQRLRSSWNETVKAINPGDVVASIEGKEPALKELATLTLEALHAKYPAARYPAGDDEEGWSKALRWAEDWQKEETFKEETFRAARLNLRDCLNAAWQIRMDWRDKDRISSRDKDRIRKFEETITSILERPGQRGKSRSTRARPRNLPPVSDKKGTEYGRQSEQAGRS